MCLTDDDEKKADKNFESDDVTFDPRLELRLRTLPSDKADLVKKPGSVQSWLKHTGFLCLGFLKLKFGMRITIIITPIS